MESVKSFFEKVIAVIKTIMLTAVIGGLCYIAALVLFRNVEIPAFSWWSATFLSDTYSESIITEVEASGKNLRSVMYIDAAGRICTGLFATSPAGFDCDYPPEDKKDWTIKDYKKAMKK